MDANQKLDLDHVKINQRKVCLCLVVKHFRYIVVYTFPTHSWISFMHSTWIQNIDRTRELAVSVKQTSCHGYNTVDLFTSLTLRKFVQDFPQGRICIAVNWESSLDDIMEYSLSTWFYFTYSTLKPRNAILSTHLTLLSVCKYKQKCIAWRSCIFDQCPSYYMPKDGPDWTET